MFLGGPSPKAEIKYHGTCFLAAFKDFDGKLYSYIVTARHVAAAVQGDDTFFIRANLKAGGGSEPIPIHNIDWAYSDDDKTIDLAVAAHYLDKSKYDLDYLNLDTTTQLGNFAGSDDVIRSHVACGDEVCVVGLFHLHSGKARNVPVVHTGHIAVLADPDERIPLRNKLTEKTVRSEVHLVEIQSLDGLSGSPAFIAQMMDLPIRTPEGNHPQAYAGVKLLGIYVGSWDGDPDEVLKKDRRLSDGTKVPVGMGLVVPANKLVDLIRTHPKLVDGRNRDREDAENAGQL